MPRRLPALRKFLLLAAIVPGSLIGCVEDNDPGVVGEGEAEGEDPCGEQLSGDRRYGIMPGNCPGTSTACATPQAPSGCNVRPGGLTCTSPPGSGTTILEVCPACVAPNYASITAAVAAIPAVPATKYWVQVDAGSYTDNVTVTKTSTSTNTITIAARCVGGVRDAVTVTAATANPVLQVTPAATRSVTIEGLRVQASASASTFGAVALRGETGTVKDVVVTGATDQAAFYVGAKDATLTEIDALDSKYGLQVLNANNLALDRGAFCGSKENGIHIEGGSGLRSTSTLVQDSAIAGVHVDLSASDVRFNRLVTRGQTSVAGSGVELWDVNGFRLWHSQVTDNTFGILVDLGATDMEAENVLFARHHDGRAIEVSTGYTGGGQLHVRYSTFADGLYAIRLLAAVDLRLRRNIFYAGSAPGGYGLDFVDGSAVLGEALENLSYGNYGVGQECQDYGGGQCSGWSPITTDPFMLGDGYYLEEDRSGAVNAASVNANSITLGDGTLLSDYTTSLDLGLDGNAGDLGFHHPPCFETVGDAGCGDGYCAGGETSGSCARDCP